MRTSLFLPCLIGGALLLPACGEGHAPDKNPSRKNPTIVGFDSSKLRGPAGDYFRGEKKRLELERKRQQWLRPPDLDFGERRIDTVVKGRYKLRNPTAEDQYITSISKSCTCQKVILHLNGESLEVSSPAPRRIKVPAGATGELEIHVKIPSLGRKVVEVRMATTDEESRVIAVRAVVVGIKDFITEVEGRVSGEVYLGLMTTRTVKEFAVKVRAKDGGAFELTGHGHLAKGLLLHYEPADPSKTVWWIRGTYGPGLHEGGAKATVDFRTDRKEGFTVQVTAFVSPPITIEPDGPMAFNVIQQSKGATRSVRLKSVHPDDRFSIDEVKLVDCKIGEKGVQDGDLSFKVESSADRRSAVVSLTVPPGGREGMLRGSLEILFKDAVFEPRSIPFYGFIRE
ncbi:MAG: hypothetical protein ACE5F1_00100 [Planctomycetota bacterium]